MIEKCYSVESKQPNCGHSMSLTNQHSAFSLEVSVALGQNGGEILHGDLEHPNCEHFVDLTNQSFAFLLQAPVEVANYEIIRYASGSNSI